MEKEKKIPEATIERIALYSRPLENLLKGRVSVISSETLSEICKVNPAQVRKDLSYFGEFGVRGVGYDVQDLLSVIKKILASDRYWRLGIAGMGNFGMAVIQHENFSKRGYKFVAAFDSNPQYQGKTLANGLVIQPLTEIRKTVPELGIEIGVVTTRTSQAQKAADMFEEAGIRAILNFAPYQVRKSTSCLVENVDFTVNLDNMAYHLGKKDR